MIRLPENDCSPSSSPEAEGLYGGFVSGVSSSQGEDDAEEVQYPYHSFVDLLINLTQFGDATVGQIIKRLPPNLINPGGMIDTELLRKVIKVEDIQELYASLTWYALIKHGTLKISSSLTDNLHEVGIFIQLVELVVPGVCRIDSEGSSWTLENTCAIVQGYSRSKKIVQEDDCYAKVLGVILSTIAAECEPDAILQKVVNSFEIDKSFIFDQYRPIFHRMDTNNRVRWTLFISLAAYHLPNISVNPGVYPKGIPEELIPLVKLIDFQLAGLQAVRRLSHSSDSLRTLKRLSPEPYEPA